MKNIYICDKVRFKFSHSNVNFTRIERGLHNFGLQPGVGSYAMKLAYVLQLGSENVRQALFSETPFLLANHPKHERASADEIVEWPCLQRRVKPNRPSDETDDTLPGLPPCVV
jgi:hypothetical protein